MIRIAHLLPGMGVGGSEQMVLQLCKFRDSRVFACAVGVPNEGVIADEIRDTGTPVRVGPAAFEQVAADADLVNLHWFGFDNILFDRAQAAGKPLVTTLHWPATLPPLPALTICTSHATWSRQHDHSRFVSIPNGVDLTRFVPPPPRARDRVVITRVCRPSRCAPYFWEAMAEILRRYPQAELRIVGNERPCRPNSERIRFLGVRRDIPEILSDADLFVYTPYPRGGTNDLVVMEASAMGVPCVVSDVNAVRESVVEGVNGYRTPYGSVDAVCDRVDRLIKDPALRARMGRAAAQLAEERFDARRVTARYERVYLAVLAAYRRHGQLGPWLSA